MVSASHRREVLWHSHIFTHYDFCLWPLTLKSFSAIATRFLNICGKFQWNPLHSGNSVKKYCITRSMCLNALTCGSQWRTGPPGNREISRWAPASWSFSGPQPYMRICSLIISWHSRQTSSAFSTRVTTCAVYESEWAYDGDVSYSFTCGLPPTRIKTISDENKKPSCVFTTITAGTN